MTYRELADKLVRLCQGDGLHACRADAGQPNIRSTVHGAISPRSAIAPRPAGIGTPDEFLRFLFDTLHQRGIGVILDWAPAISPDDPARACLCSTERISTRTPRSAAKAIQPEWNTLIYQLRPPRGAGSILLISNALYWRQRPSASTVCGSMQSPRCCTSTTRRKPGEWSPNSSAAAKTSKRSPFSAD